MYFPILSRRGLQAKLKVAYAHITLNRYTAAFFVFSFIYCFIQGIVQSLLFSTDQTYSTLVSGIVRGGDIPFNNTAYLVGSHGHLILRMCTDIPHGQSPDPCIVIFNSTAPPTNISSVRTLGEWQKGLEIDPIYDSSNQADVIAVDVTVPGNDTIQLTEQCLKTLTYTSQVLQNFIREDITWVCLQFWLLAISFLAIVNDSVPHVLAVLMARTITTAWAGYALWRGPAFNGNFKEIIGEAGTPCSLEVFDAFFSTRQKFEIADMLLSCTGIVFFFYLSWTLLQIYSAQSFKCVGAPEHVMRIHKFFMAVLACLQIEAFVLPAGMGLWINVLSTTSIRVISAHTPVYQALYISSVTLLIPWIVMGWYSIRREMKTLMVVFLAIGFIIILGWCLMFDSLVFRWEFMQWPYLGCFVVASLILLTASVVLGIVCRINFGKGLAEYLHAESTLAALNFAPDEFAHRTNSVRSSHEKKTHSVRSSFDNTEGYLDGPQKFFVSTLPDMGRADEHVNVVRPPIATTNPRSRSTLNMDIESARRSQPIPF